MAAGENEKAAQLFREAITNSRGHFPASHNNLGVLLAFQGNLREAEKEFKLAVVQAKGGFAEADHNLKLCRLLIKHDGPTEIAQNQFQRSTNYTQ
jgi:Tfp pilus assembly protein PilF